jgi:hypothetical protein
MPYVLLYTEVPFFHEERSASRTKYTEVQKEAEMHATTHIADANTRKKIMKMKKQHKNKRNNGIAITISFPFFYFALLFQKINGKPENKKRRKLDPLSSPESNSNALSSP